MRKVTAVAWRLVQALPIALGVTLLTFLLVHIIPGDPARTVLGSHASQSSIAALRAQWGLDRPLIEQYWDYLVQLVQGDLGQSLFYRTSITEIIGRFFAPTIWLMAYSAVLSVVISVGVAVPAAIRRGGWFDQGARVASQIGLGMPQPWVGLLLILALGIKVKLFPVSGFGRDFVGHVHSMFLPSLTIAIAIAPILIRALRAEMIEVLGADYITTARAKGISERRVLIRHALRNAAISGVTILGLNIAWLASGTVVVEMIYGVPGLGQLLVDSFNRRDFPLIQGLALIFALVVIFVNIFTDVARSLLDPRVTLR